MSNILTATVVALTSAAVAAVEPAAVTDTTPYLLCFLGVAAGTFGRFAYWLDKNGWRPLVIVADVTSMPVLYALAIGTAAYLQLSPPIAAAVSGVGALIGIEPLRKLALAAIRMRLGVPNEKDKPDAVV